MPLVSVIVPCYNYGHFLPRTLDNLLEQDYPYWECIIVNDGSRDNTAEVGRAYEQLDSRFRLISQANAGLSAARNTGLAASKGQFIQFLDADDLLAPTKLRLQLELFEQHPEASVVYGDALFFHTDHPEKLSRARAGAALASNAPLKLSGRGEAVMRNLCVNNFIDVSSPLGRKSLYDAVGPFDTVYRSYEDWQYWFRCAMQGAAFVYAPKAGTETLIRYGHASMLTNQPKLVAAGLQIRRFMEPQLPASMRIYNRYRMLKLQLKGLLLKLKLIR